MKVIMVMFDSLNRRMLPNYGCDWTYMPNFERLGKKTVTFDNYYAGSLPCMPARRDLHTGRYSFLHRSWGPLEPYDNSMPEILKENGVYSHLVSDHYHYWEDGGATYHTRYSSWEMIRGQEADTWVGQVKPPHIPDHLPTMREFTHPEWWENSWRNRAEIRKNNAWPQVQTFEKGLKFLERNKDEDNWFLQIETFDPHEPFDVPDEYKAHYDDVYDGLHHDWPSYAPVTESPEVVKHTKLSYAALLSMCDYNLGKILDFMDENEMWKDTMLIVNTDHGFMLGEKDWWAKAVMPCYNEVAHIPLFIWDPRSKISNKRRSSLVQMIDIPATVIDFFNLPIPEEMEGKTLTQTIERDLPVREAALFGFHGSFVNVTDGRYVYMKSAVSLANEPLYEYTLMPTRPQGFFQTNEFDDMEVCGPFYFSKGSKMMKIKSANRLANATFCNSFQYGDLLWDLEEDPNQLSPLDDLEIESKLISLLCELLEKNNTPVEQYDRLGLPRTGQVKPKDIEAMRKQRVKFEDFPIASEYEWTQNARNIFIGMLALMPNNRCDEYISALREIMAQDKSTIVERRHFEQMANRFYSDSEGKNFYFLNKLSRML